VDFNFTEEQTALQDSIKRFIANEYGFEKRRELARSKEGFSPDAWRQYAEFGILALPFPESYGGLNGTAVDTMVVMEALGPGLVLEPYLATVVLCGHLIRDAGSDAQKKTLLAAIGGGELKMAPAHYEPATRYELNHVATTARPDGKGWILDGAKTVVLHGGAADKLVVSARTAGKERDDTGVSLFILDRAAAGVSVRSFPTQDANRAADITLKGVRVDADALLGAKDKALPALERALDYGIAALCAEVVGIVTALNAATLEYLKTRQQFGQPIGKFQALQHRMVDMTIAAEQARSMMYLAAVRADSADAVERRRAISIAKAYIGQATRFIGQQAVQLHGGMGVTDELIVGHWFKRLTLINTLFGDADHHLGKFSDMLLSESAPATATAASAPRESKRVRRGAA
jgi:alkylation response protein AidB-like acyl-CoA dehydrogenase